MNTTLTRERSLTTADRCDRCGAQAYMVATLPSGRQLSFCAHHGRIHADKLQQIAIDIHDESDHIR